MAHLFRLILVPLLAGAASGAEVTTDLCIYGGTSAGVVAGMQARRMGAEVVIVAPDRHLGGLSSGGLSMTDTGNAAAIGGAAREFYSAVLEHYVRTYGPDSEQVANCAGGFRFEPHVAERIFDRWVREYGVPVHFGHRVDTVTMRDGRITSLATLEGLTVRARVFIDATYEGDLMARAGVTYTTGREAAAKYRERYNGVQFGHPHHNFRVPVDPYIIEGDPDSGLLPGVSDEHPGHHGYRDHRIQAYNYRMCLTSVPENRLPFPKPDDYDPARYELLARYIRNGVFDALADCIDSPVTMPNGKKDTNNNGGFSTDNIGMNYDYPDGDYETRERIIQEHRSYQMGLMWFLSQDERVPAELRARVNEWGLCKDEFVDNDGWPHQLYVREARRMVADYVMTENNAMGRASVDDSIGLASYNMDSHNTQRFVRDGSALNEGDVQIGLPMPYGVSYRSIVPARGQCQNLFVPVCLSSSHIAYGSIRMEPVFMILAQSSATAAVMALERGIAVQDVDVKALQERLVQDGQIIEWDPALGGQTVAPPIDPSTLEGVAMDDLDAEKVGDWRMSTMAYARRLGTGYVHDANEGKGQKRVIYRPTIPAAGRYEIIVISPPNPNRATNAPISVVIDSAVVAVVPLDMRSSDTNGFGSIGVFELPEGDRTEIVVGTDGTDGHVVADGLQLLPVE